jgi:hypothetical protein
MIVLLRKVFPWLAHTLRRQAETRLKNPVFSLYFCGPELTRPEALR